MDNLSGKKCLHAALRLLGRRDHSCKELASKLGLRGFRRQEIALAIEECRRLEYIDDPRFCRAYAGQLKRKGYGARRIAQMLRTKGLDESHITDVLESQCNHDAQIDDCRRALTKKLNTIHQPQDSKALEVRLQRFLLQRGFSSSVIWQVLKEARPTWKDP